MRTGDRHWQHAATPCCADPRAVKRRANVAIFGGGHLVLPLLHAEVVPSGWISNDVFLNGYGAAQAVPGPLFTFAAFLGASFDHASFGWLGGVVCLIAVFAPSFLLAAGILPFWEDLRSTPPQAAQVGVNAGVVGLLLAALIVLVFWKVPPWLVVLATVIVNGLWGVPL